MAQAAHDEQQAGVQRPMNGQEYLETLRTDARSGSTARRSTTSRRHPAFRNGARSVARLYDALHDPETKDVLTTRPTPAAAATRTRSSGAALSAEDLVRGRDAIARGSA
jgi:4-hydroxyphenylacetate 3-monooxygenase